MMKLGREIIQDELRMLDKLILKYRDKDTFKPKDFQPTTLKTRLGEIPISRRRYKEEIITKKAEKKIKEELAERVPEPNKIAKIKYREMKYAGTQEIAYNFTGRARQHVIDGLRDKKCSELMIIN